MIGIVGRTTLYYPVGVRLNNKVNNPTWKVKDVSSAEMTKLEDEPTISSAVASKDFWEKAKCKWCANQGHKAQGYNIRLKKIEDTKEEIKNQTNN